MINLKLAFRTLFKSPFVALVAILSLGLGIGANAAIFSLYNRMLLQPLPVHDPDRLVNLAAPGPNDGSQSCNQAGGCDEVFSYLMFRDLERVQTVFTGIALHRLFGANLAYRGQTTSGEGVLVSGSYFPVLGVQPALGRLLGPADEPKYGEALVVVLSHAYWKSRFGEDPNVVGQVMTVNGQQLTIVGVAPAGFTGTTLGSTPHVFVPVTLYALMAPGWNGFENRRTYWAYLFARLKPGVAIEEAAAQINGPYRAILNDVEAALQTGMSDQTLARFKAKEVTVKPGARGQSSTHREARAPLLLLLAVTGLVLVIACANIANLLLARSAARAGEMAVRLSIGASRRHLIAQLLTESCLLALLGGLAGLLVARWTLSAMAAMLPAQAASTIPFELSTAALLFAAVLTLGTGLLFGLFPALHSTRPDLLSTLKGQAGQPSGAKSASLFRTSLATAQIALSMALLVSAGLFTKSLFNVSRIDLGLKIDSLVTFMIAPARNGYTAERAKQLYERLETEIAALPGVVSVTSSRIPSIGNSSSGNDVAVEGFKAGPDTDSNARYNEIGPGYFRTMGVPLLAGREFTPADALKSPKVAIVNEAFAKKFNLGRDVVGKRMGTGSGYRSPLDIEIVGLVQSTKYNQVKGEVPPLFFRPHRQIERVNALTFYVRTAGGAQVITLLPKVVAGLDGTLPVDNLRTMEQQVADNVFLDRFLTILSTAFASLATLLAAIGLYGVLAYTIAQRTREIGLRMALGAAPERVRRMVLGQVGRMTIVGGLVGLAGAIALGRAAQALLFEVKGHDPAILVGSSIVLALVALAAGFVPALRASRVDPMRALRYE